MSKFVEKIRKPKRYDEEYGYEQDLNRIKKKDKLHRAELKRMKTQEYEDFSYLQTRRYR